MYSAEQLQVSGATSPGAGLTGDDCSLDYITIAGAGATAGADSSTYDRSWSRQLLGRIYVSIIIQQSDLYIKTAYCFRYCGGKLTLPPDASTSVTVLTNVSPFMVGVHLDGTEANPSTSTTEANIGFSLYYEQIKCS